jgi:hypothetical protein
MLWLWVVERADSGFFESVRVNEAAWIGAHMVLLISTILLLPAAISIRSAVHNRAAGAIGTLMVVVIAPTSILLAGQYAIDFVVPLMIEVGGDALKVHGQLYASRHVHILFYGLPNLAFLALMVLSIALVWSGPLGRLSASLLMVNWLAVLLGNLIHPLFQRFAILLLAVSFMPFVLRVWRHSLAPRSGAEMPP